jgi:hypothetical protein
MELAKQVKHEVWGKLYEIPSNLQPTVFVIQPGSSAPTMNTFKVIPDPEDKQTFFLYLFHFSDADVARNIPLAAHISRVVIKDLKEIGWSSYKTNLFVIGWVTNEIKEDWKKFIINFLETINV